MKSLTLKYLLVFLFWSLRLALYSQAPANDNCENADEIIISNSGYDYGTFNSRKFIVDNATKQKGEKCAKELEDNGNCDKTVWFKFYIPTTRNISIKLTQKDSAIPQIFAGFNVYKIKNCDYTLADLALNLSPLNKFGESGNTCLNQGWYFIQVGCKQKVKGELWLELTSAVQATQQYDLFTQAYDFGLVKDREVWASINPACASVDKNEANAINDSSFSKSVFFKFTLSKDAVYNRAQFFFSGSYKSYKYRIFKDNINADSVNGNKPFLQLNKNGYFDFILEACPLNNANDRTYCVQLICDNSSNVYYQINVSNYTYKADAWNTTATDDIINTNNGFTRTLTHNYNCEGQLKNHLCKSVIPDSFSRFSVNYKGDTMRYHYRVGGYTVINVSESGTLKVVSKDMSSYSMTMFYTLYKGNVTNGCNLVQLASSYVQNFDFCVEPGVYTLVTAIEDLSFFAPFRHTVSQVKPVLNTVHFTPKDPEQLGVYFPLNRLAKLSSGINFKIERDTIIKIDTLTLKGNFIYREFYLNDTSDISIEQNNYNVTSLYVVKGRLSKGNAHLIKDYVYTGVYYFKLPNCRLLDSGYYTIISRIDSLKKTVPCVSPLNTITIRPPNICTQYFHNEASKANKLNNNVDVLTANANKSNLDYVFPLMYCQDCKTITKEKPYLLKFKKRFTNPETQYSFFTFYLGSNAEFRVPQLDYHTFELYKGNATQNPSLIKDSLNIVSACDAGNNYCNLKGGEFYTIVVFNYSGWPSAYFTPHQVSINDFAKRSYNFGNLAAGNVSSTPIPITCHTNAYDSDPCSLENGQRRCQRWADKLTIPFKDTQNIKRPYTRKNLWYTFTVDNASNITVRVSARTTMLKNPKMNLFRYNGTFNYDFNAVLNNQFDSTEKSMEWLATNTGYVDQSQNRNNSFTFTNQGCATNRYFILLEDESYYDMAHYEYIVTITNTPVSLVNDGDFCNNAIATTINSYSTKLVSVNNICHTYGNSPYETPYDKTLKSAWYKINISNLKSCDIKIRNTQGAGLLYYNVYGGSCNAMTKIAHLADVYSYFTLSCMGSGTYYIQAVCQRNVTGVIEFEVTAIAPQNPNCKPYDFRMPIAQFKMGGGCNNDTLKLTNISTSGSGISYSWFINTNYLSSKTDEQLLLSNPLVNPKNNIRLIVKNTIDNFSDTSVQSFEKDTNRYVFKIQAPVLIKCRDTFTLSVLTNFPNKINYSWTHQYNKTPEYVKTMVVRNMSNNMMFYVAGESDNCRFKDSVLLKVARTLNRYRDTVICSGEPYTLKAKKDGNLFVNNELVSDSLNIYTSGTYFVRYVEQGCQYDDTMSLTVDTDNLNTVKIDSVYACKSPIKLKYPYGKLTQYKWNTGDTVPEIFTGKAGTYTLTGRVNACRTIEYKQVVAIELLDADILEDRMVCKGDTLEFINPYPQLSLVSKTPTTNPIIATTGFKQKMILKKDRCLIEDSAFVKVLPPNYFRIDSFYCEKGGVFNYMLDGGVGTAYYWPYDKSTSRYLNIPGYGRYKLARTNLMSCVDTLDFNIREDCPFKIYVPNVFSPNGDNTNELFVPSIAGEIRSFRLQIFNRWGEKLYDGLNKGWDGYYKHERVQQGVYLYLLDVYDARNRGHYFNGTFTVLR